MKTLFTLFVCLFFAMSIQAQNLIINGSFENNTATGNTYDVTSGWPALVANSYEVDGGTMNLLDSAMCGATPAGASDGIWYIGVSSNGWPYLSFSLRLTGYTVVGQPYFLSLDKRFCINSSAIDVGLNTDSSLMGTIVHTFAAPSTNTWSTDTFTFVAPVAANFLTVNVGIAGGTGGINLDNFILLAGGGNVGIAPVSNASMQVFPTLVNDALTVTLVNASASQEILITDLAGRTVQTVQTTNQQSVRFSVSQLPVGMYLLRLSGSSASPVRFSKI